MRQCEITNVVRNTPGTQGDYFLGIHRDEVITEVIGGGQADFDQPYRHLHGHERTLLYAYFNQLGHIEELLEAFKQLFRKGPPRDPLIVLDLGCGPFTGGLALAAAIGISTPFTYIGMDRSFAMRDLGERLAAAAEKTGFLNCPGRQWIEDFAAFSHGGAPGWRPVLIIASYLLASSTLDAKGLAENINALCEQFGRGPVTILYTNSAVANANRGFQNFRDTLATAGFEIVADDQGSITIDRIDGQKERKLRYALFHRPPRRVLDI